MGGQQEGFLLKLNAYLNNARFFGRQCPNANNRHPLYKTGNLEISRLQEERLQSGGNNNNLLVISNIIENYEFNYFESPKCNGRILIIKTENAGGLRDGKPEVASGKVLSYGRGGRPENPQSKQAKAGRRLVTTTHHSGE